MLESAYQACLAHELRGRVEIKTVSKVLPVHEAQVISYLRLGGYQLGLLINFHVPALRDGIRRFVNELR